MIRSQLRLHDAGFDVERRMPEYRIAGDEPPAYLQRHARIALTAVPVRVILGELALVRDLRRLGLQFLQTHHVRSLALQPLSDLGGTRPDAVHIPRGDFHPSPITCRAHSPRLRSARQNCLSRAVAPKPAAEDTCAN